MATLLRLGEESEARELLHDVRTSFPTDISTQLAAMIAADRTSRC